MREKERKRKLRHSKKKKQITENRDSYPGLQASSFTSNGNAVMNKIAEGTPYLFLSFLVQNLVLVKRIEASEPSFG